MKQTKQLHKIAEEFIHTKVFIPELSQSGTIIAVFIGDYGVQYSVRYFLNGEAKQVYMFDHEIQIPAFVGGTVHEARTPVTEKTQ